jgi:hypothetical protein
MPVKLRKPLGSAGAQSIERKARDVPLPIGLNNYIIIFAHRPSGTHLKDLKAKSITAGPGALPALCDKKMPVRKSAPDSGRRFSGSEL